MSFASSTKFHYVLLLITILLLMALSKGLKKILQILRHVVSKLVEFWQDWLPHVAATINVYVNSSNGKTLFLVRRKLMSPL